MSAEWVDESKVDFKCLIWLVSLSVGRNTKRSARIGQNDLPILFLHIIRIYFFWSFQLKAVPTSGLCPTGKKIIGTVASRGHSVRQLVFLPSCSPFPSFCWQHSHFLLEKHPLPPREGYAPQACQVSTFQPQLQSLNEVTSIFCVLCTN